jgi:putative ABC transport system ATP-binding protein
VPLIEVRALTKLYQMGDSVVRALDGVDLDIERGEFVAITGASGSGKSTIMHLLGCLDRPTAGVYRLDGRDVSGLSDSELAVTRNLRIGFVFQTFNLINRVTAWENVGVPLFYARKTNTKAPAFRALERVGLASRAAHQPNELSGGERQRVAIARAIVNDPLLVLADEPTGNLDTRTGEQIMEIFRGLNEQGVTVIMVTHEAEIAQQARRIVQMRDGKILSDRPTKDIVAERGHAPPRKLPSVEPAAPLDAAAPPPLDVAGAPPVEVAAAQQETPIAASALPPRIVRGAMPAIVCGLVAAALWVLGYAAQVALQKIYGYKPEAMDPMHPKMPPMPVIIGSGIASLGMLVGVVLAILAIVSGYGARRRARTEIGNWQGRRRALVGLILGWVVVAIPIIVIIIAVVKLATGGFGGAK